MSSLTPSASSVTSGSSPSWTLVIDGIGGSCNWSLSNGAFGTYLSAGTYTINAYSITIDTTCYVTIYNTDGSHTSLSSTILIGTGAVAGSYVPILDYTAPVSTPKKLYSPDLFNTATGVFGFGNLPFKASVVNGLQIPFFGGYNTSGTGIAPAITMNISGSATVVAGNNISFNISATGDTPLTFTWYKNGVSYWVDPAPTSGHYSTLTLTAVPIGDNGATYYCTVSNASGSATTGTVTLTVSSSSIVAFRPTSGTGISAYPNAIDTTGTTVDSTTNSSTSSPSGSYSYTFSGFGTGTYSGTLNIRAAGTTEIVQSASLAYTAESSLSISYAYNGGAAISLLSSAGGTGDPVSTTPLVSSVLSNINLSTLIVTATLTGQKTGPISDLAVATATLALYDIVFITQ